MHLKQKRKVCKNGWVWECVHGLCTKGRDSGQRSLGGEQWYVIGYVHGSWGDQDMEFREKQGRCAHRGRMAAIGFESGRSGWNGGIGFLENTQGVGV